MTSPLGRVLIIAGSDSGGGAGIQADIKAVTMLGGYAATAITAITVQNTLGVHGVHPLPLDLIEAQARAVLDDIGADAVKTGMLGSVEVVERVAAILDTTSAPVVVDPVMVAKGGGVLAGGPRRGGCAGADGPARGAADSQRARDPSPDGDGGRRSGRPAPSRGGAAGHGREGGADEGRPYRGPHGDRPAAHRRRRDGAGGRAHYTRHTHGTGCTLASACTAGIALGKPLEVAVAEAWAYVAEAIRRAPGLGGGHGPLDHGWPIWGRG